MVASRKLEERVPTETKGLIVRTYCEGQAILWSYVPEVPSEEVCRALSWLTVVSWRYDGTNNAGMPDKDTNQLMLGLDSALDEIEHQHSCREAYRRIGRGLREFVYYTADQGEFLDKLNLLLSSHPPYPIEITFYADESWSDFKKLLNDFSKA